MAGDPGAHLSILQQVNRLRALTVPVGPALPPPICLIIGHSWARNLQSFLYRNPELWTPPHFQWRVEHVSTITQALNTGVASRVASLRPAVILLMLGGNDLGTADQFQVRQRYLQLVDELLEHNPRTTVVCSQIERRFPPQGPTSRPLYSGFEVESSSLNQAIKRRVAQGVKRNNHRVRLFQLRGAYHTPDSRDKYLPDGVHLNIKGNKCLVARLSALLCRVQPCDVEADDSTLFKWCRYLRTNRRCPTCQ